MEDIWETLFKNTKAIWPNQFLKDIYSDIFHYS